MDDRVPGLAASAGLAGVLQLEERRPGDQAVAAEPGEQRGAPLINRNLRPASTGILTPSASSYASKPASTSASSPIPAQPRRRTKKMATSPHRRADIQTPQMTTKAARKRHLH